MKAIVSTRSLLSLLLLAACAWMAPTPAMGQTAATGPGGTVAVDNQATVDARVYVVKGGHMVPLGLVEAAKSEVLSLPPYFAQAGGQIELVADLIGNGRWFEGDPVTIRPSDTVRLTIDSGAVHSAVVSR